MNLTGVWLGQTVSMGYTAIHVWIISQRGKELTIVTQWFALEGNKNIYFATMPPDYDGVAAIYETGRFMTIVNENNFYVENWSMGGNGDEAGKWFPVNFQRRDHGIFAMLINGYIRLFRNKPQMLRLLNR